MISEYKQLNTFDDRIKESNKIISKYENKIPIILERYRSKNIEKENINELHTLKKNKYLVPSDLKVCQFLFVIRKKINLSSEQSLYLFCNNTLLCSNTEFGFIYDSFKDKDNFLYLFYDKENTFG